MGTTGTIVERLWYDAVLYQENKND